MTGPLRAGELPELRAHLLREWEPNSLLYQATALRGTVVTATIGAPRDGVWQPEVNAKWERKTLRDATLWFVSADMVDVLLTAARSVPGDVLPTDLQPLSRYGFVVLEKPWPGLAVDLDGDLMIDAFMWGPVNLPPLREHDEPDVGVQAVAVSSYQCYTDDEVVHNAPSINGRVWGHLGRSDWPMRDALDTAPWEMPEQARASFAEDRRVLVALTTLLAHGGIAQVRHEHAPRAVARRLARAGELPRQDAAVRVVTLRTLREPADWKRKAGDDDATHDHRWIVGAATGGFWRNQAYGPKHSLRRLQWIMPYVAGPEDMPLRVPETVHAWRR